MKASQRRTSCSPGPFARISVMSSSSVAECSSPAGDVRKHPVRLELGAKDEVIHADLAGRPGQSQDQRAANAIGDVVVAVRRVRDGIPTASRDTTLQADQLGRELEM